MANGNEKNPPNNQPLPPATAKPEIKILPKAAQQVSINKPPLILIHDLKNIDKIYSHADLENIYRLKVGTRRGLHIWIVDGAKVRRELYTNFISGGNDQRYKFIPPEEIWIDNAFSAEELEFTIIYQLHERELLKQGVGHEKAVSLAGEEELKARINQTESLDELRARLYRKTNGAKTENIAPAPAPPNKKADVSLGKPPMILIQDPNRAEKVYSHADLENIYRLKVGTRKGLHIWIVDGAKIRREIYIYFVLGGNDQRYKFIPMGEIWVDNAVSVEEMEFTILHEIYERELMLHQGLTYAKAHEQAAREEQKARINKNESLDDLRERWYKAQENLQKNEEQQKTEGIKNPVSHKQIPTQPSSHSHKNNISTNAQTQEKRAIDVS
ncbi:MAG: hypothetical protein COV91_03780 [Candidatus Taylorbacteria bacterium CG11_big_fil_rev_8_21_14_0_20_46_11]|uniref:Uncharacterized protein n=1 Tax=Candidatus Taylorbacteria bacterium CG11_big_fil_rev_8_21_14_0_20_46_11 TaxID=1975025 RepID=A0A2H0KB82_9BACT|nr:MAG: hypothetical protein COV91_03780 [Candidatus Taylorbacteria bacterium CG11_big_fil_rev_8_21_14_0_20_46_11]